MGELGKRLVRALLEAPDLSVLADKGVGEDDLLDDAKKTFRWALRQVRDRGEWPTAKQLGENTGVFLPAEADPLEYAAELVRKRSLGKGLEKALRKSAGLLESRDPDEAARVLSEESARLSARSAGVSAASYRETGVERLRAYRRAAEGTDGFGVPSPWKRLNTAICGRPEGGFEAGTLNVLTAVQGTGKTWWLCLCADHALSLKYRVLLCTLEMPTARIMRRLDSLHYRVPFGRLRSASLDGDELETWENLIGGDAKAPGDILVADKQTVRTVADAASLVIAHRPDLVLVDGGYRFEGHGRGHWEETVSIVNDLQTSAESSGVPWVVTTQQKDIAEKGKKRNQKTIASGDIRYGQEWNINPDVLIGLVQGEDLRLMKRMETHVLKLRDAAGETGSGKFSIRWDFQAMDFSEIDGEEPDATVDF